MTDYRIENTSRTNMSSSVKDFSVDSINLEQATGDESFYDYPNSKEYTDYFLSIPELNKAVGALATWSVGGGYDTDALTRVELEHVSGWGEDTIESILWNLLVQKKVLGDAYAEIIRGENGDLLNLKPLYTGDMRVVVGKNGIIKRYEQRTGEKTREFKRIEILHLVNERYANQIHGTSVIQSLKWVIDARHEALTDYRKVLHRNVVPVRIIEIDTDDTAKRDRLIAQYEDAIKKGEVLVIPKGTVSIADTSITIQDPVGWIKSLENYFYIALGVPKVILGGSEEFTEASSKIAYLTFEAVYRKEQRELEADLWNQLGIKIKFKKQASLQSEMLSSEEKNTGQVGFQPNDTMAGVGK